LVTSAAIEKCIISSQQSKYILILFSFLKKPIAILN
jgi:hypothetical protein